jgi:tetratricopeptide (TPR) repeat protein
VKHDAPVFKFKRSLHAAPTRFCGEGLLVLLLAAASPAVAGADSAAAPSQPPPLAIEDTPEPFEPKLAAPAAAARRGHALALYAAGREYEREQNYARALRCYQRAFRYAPATTVGFAIIRLAKDKLDRHAEADRYLVKVIETIEGVDADLLRELADYLTQKGRWQRAAELLRRVLEDPDSELSPAEETVLRMQIGQLLHLTEQYDKAADYFQRVIDSLEQRDQLADSPALKSLLLDEAGPTLNLLGESFLLAGRLDQAQRAFEEAHRANGDDGLLGYYLARVAKRREQPRKALNHLQKYFQSKLASEGSSPYRLLAELLRETGQADQLVPRLEKLLEEDPANAPLRYYLVERYRENGQLEKAATLARALLEDAPTIAAYRHLVDVYRRQEDFAAVLDVLGKLVDRLGAVEPLREEGERLARDRKAVEALAEAARARLKKSTAALSYSQRLAIALLGLQAKRAQLTAEFFELAVEAKPEATAELLLTWSIGLLVDERYARAIEVLRRGAESELPRDDRVEFYYYLAAALEAEGRTDEAIRAARKATDLEKDAPRLLSRLAWVLYHGGRHDEAARVYGDLVERFDDQHESSDVRQVLRDARLVLSNLAVMQGRVSEAEEWLEQVLDEFPDDVSAMNDLGYLWADADENLEMALGMIEKAVQSEPDNAAYRDSLGWVLYRLGRYDEAVAELEKAAAGDDPDPVILDHLADAYLAAGRPKKALEFWATAAEKLEQQIASDSAVESDAARRLERLREKIADHRAKPQKPPGGPAPAPSEKKPQERPE